jgi:hypothetical protein
MRVRVAFVAALVVGLAALGCGKKEPEPPPALPAPPVPPGGVAPPGGTGAPPAAPSPDALKAETAKRLKEIGLAFHNFESANQVFPAGVVGPDGNLGLSWRVALLPYLDQGALYGQFKLNERWDSEHNKKLIPKMPSVFAHPAQPSSEGNTHFRALTGRDAFVPLPAPWVPKPNWAAHWRAQPGFPALGRAINSITDGTSNTLMVAEAAAVPWTKPDELPYQEEFVKGGAPKPAAVPKFGGPFAGGFHALMCDGKVVFFPDTLGEAARRAIVTASGGEVDPEAHAILWPAPPKAPPAPVGVPDALPDAAARKIAVANFQKLANAAHAHNDGWGQLPGGFASANGPGLSWRVALLPHIGEEALYKQFKLDEPWDGPTNKPLLEKMPKVFASGGKAAPAGHTFVRTTQGPGGIIPIPVVGKGKPPGLPGAPPVPGLPGAPPGPPLPKPGFPLPANAIQRIGDGSGITLLFVEAAESVPWTKPDELTVPYVSAIGEGPFPVPELGGAFADGFHAALGDGRVMFLKKALPKGELAKLLTPHGGEVADDATTHAVYVAGPQKPDEAKLPGPPKAETKPK